MDAYPPGFGGVHRRGRFGPCITAPSGFTFRSWRAGRPLPVFCRMAPSRCAFLLPTSIRSGLRRIAPPNMPSADFCAVVRSPRGSLSSELGTRRRPPGVSSVAFRAQLPDLRFAFLDGYGLRDTLPARPTLTPDIRFLSINSHICSALPSDPASRRQPLRIANPSPPSGWVEDFHLQATEHARHTTKPLAR